ncbi:NADPH:quinone reductase [Hahella sp. CCB-MM4]|uniref:NADP-dependent oxidoreductase n=1 Tax=Hahella sp. (strain CCB-MM4) TaxID=1926491 RepID=UPI000B9B2CB3|nr:NADP-dependent oxidoreductase [Hahella sp. CCB-MM4]OZG74604.1 NADPH:quinone reductase [Hahella sp. CCB-MM4]
MKQIQIAEFGAPDVLQCVEVEIPEPQAHQVVIKVNAMGINPIDYKTRRGLGFVAEKAKSRLPWVPGYDVAGVVYAKGAAVTGWEEGQRVCGMVNFPLPAGGYSEYVVAMPEMLAAIPDSVSDTDAAALPLAGLTAWQGLYETGNLCSGQRVAILAAAGGVGHIAAQLARHSGAQVWGTASVSHHDFLEEMGIKPVDYHDEKSLEKLKDMDFVFDAVGGETGIQALDFLATGGTLVTLPTITAEQIMQAAKERGKHARGYTVHPDAKQLQTLLEYIADKQLQINIQKRFPLEEAAQAHALLEKGHTRGKIILAV